MNLRVNPPLTKDGTRSPWSKGFHFDPEYERDKSQRQVLKALTVRKLPDDYSNDPEAPEGALQIGDGIVELNGRPVAEAGFER